jgi:hypothetical protein
VLCLLCHADTQVKGGFFRKLDAAGVIRHRHAWLERVSERRRRADALAVEAMAAVRAEKQAIIGAGVLNAGDATLEGAGSTLSPAGDALTTQGYAPGVVEKEPFADLLATLARVRGLAYSIASSASGADSQEGKLKGTDFIIRSMQDSLTRLAAHYPAGHFEGGAADFFSEMVASRYRWHSHTLSTVGHQIHDTALNLIVATEVLRDSEEMVVQIVRALLGGHEGTGKQTFETWHLQWMVGGAWPAERAS